MVREVWQQVQELEGSHFISTQEAGEKRKEWEERLYCLKPVPADVLPLETAVFWRFHNSPNSSIWKHLQTNLIPTETAGEAWRREAVAAGHIALAVST